MLLSRIVKAGKSTIVALSGVTAGTTTPAASISLANPDIENGSLVANISAGITTSSLVVKTKWQVSNDNSTWLDFYESNTPAYVQLAATGTGSLVTTAWAQTCPINISYPYVRMAVVSTGATGGAGDNLTISYNYRKR